MKKRRRLAVFLGALAVAASLTALPALATEGSFPSAQTEMPGEGTEGDSSSGGDSSEASDAGSSGGDSSSTGEDSSSGEDSGSSSQEGGGRGGDIPDTIFTG